MQTVTPRRDGASVLVTGGAGRLGRHVVRRLRQERRVVSADLAAGPLTDLELDVRDLAAVTVACADADTVVHLAALDYDTHAAPDKFIATNTLGTWHVLQAAAARGVRRVVVCSSVAALGLHEMRSDWAPAELPVFETHDARPAEAYSVSKLVLETMAAAVVRSAAIDVMCVRPAAVVFPEHLDAFMQTVQPTARSLFDYVTAADVAEAIALAIDRPWHGYEVVTVAADDSAHPAPTLEWYADIVGPVPTLRDPDRFAHSPRASVYSNKRACSLLGWRPTSDFRAIAAAAEAAGPSRVTRGSTT
jgi:UDP-glucose 4-epimerase